MKKKLYKSNDEKAIFGVCGGLAEYFDIDVIVVRLLLVLLTVAGGAGILFYIVAAIVIPSQPLYSMNDSVNYTYTNSNDSMDVGTVYENTAEGDSTTYTKTVEEQPVKDKGKTEKHDSLILGFILVAVGGYLLVRVFFPYMDGRLFAAALLIGAGVWLLAKKS